MKFVIAIPAYNPTEKILQVVTEIKADSDLNSAHLVVINDGSNLNTDLFEKIKNVPNLELITNQENQGKGSGIKTALRIGQQMEADYLITVDADAQHLTTDISKLYQKCLNEKSCGLILGTRSFPFKKTPLRSYLGNRITQIIFTTLYKENIKDTQTGLRAYHKRLFSDLLQINHNRFEFEITALIKAAEKKVSISQVDIETVYYDDNNNSNFDPVVDSIKIYRALLKL